MEVLKRSRGGGDLVGGQDMCWALTKVWSLSEPELPLLYTGTWGRIHRP